MGRNSRLTKGVTGSREQLFHEQGAIRKKWKNRLPIALIYPNTYGLGMSNLGFQLVYQLLNQNDAVVAERVFLPEPGTKPLSLESGRPLADFPLLFFSVSFEQDYQHLILLLEMSGIPPLASERTGKNQALSSKAAGGQPLVVAGGVATFMNPEPLAPFIDLFIVGEAEPILPPVLAHLLKGINGKDKMALLHEIVADLSGCYVPALYQVKYDADGVFQSNTPKEGYAGVPQRIKKVIMDAPGDVAGHSTILTPLAEFSNLFMTELGRGCSRGCRFCAAGFIYRPPRLWKAQSIIDAIDSRPENSSRVGLLGMEMARADDIARIADYLASQSCSLSFSSLRADIINSSLLELLGSSNLKSAAIAPDGGSERLRQVINKGITENDVLTAAEILVRKGIRNLKLYFMVGLPTEAQPDLDEMISLIMKVKKKILTVGRARGRLSTLTLSINCFIPKPWTPFQFHPMEKVASLKQKLKLVRKKIGGEPNIRIKTESPEKAFYQGVLSRGDRRVGHALLSMVRDNCTWKQAFIKQNIHPDDYALRRRGATEPFPWEIIDHGIGRKYLWSEYRKALEGKPTIPCDTSRCKRCGVC
ncbi:MAG: hypothetical protein AMJ60_02280 [Desulfobacterales bacterium SG8_35]|nr:MAG: hypothetical protein AMJ60_02280 [Desulfobacterales bacterium SG8_35]